jgi:TonB family protein
MGLSVSTVRLAGAAAVLVMLLGCASTGRSLELVSAVAPVYPAEARAAGQEGYVVVRYAVDAEGRVRHPVVVAAEPAGVFDAAALRTVGAWRFRPARAGAGPALIEGVESRVEFTLSAGAAYRDY